MKNDYAKQYQLITKGQKILSPNYTTPEEQGRAIKRCSILTEKNVVYNNSSKLNNTDMFTR